MFVRPTKLAEAMVIAAANQIKVDHKSPNAKMRSIEHWIARRVAANTERKGFGLVTEFDQRPNKKV